MAKRKLPGREDILERMWKLANARVEDAVRLACWPEEEPGRLEKLEVLSGQKKRWISFLASLQKKGKVSSLFVLQ